MAREGERMKGLKTSVLQRNLLLLKILMVFLLGYAATDLGHFLISNLGFYGHYEESRLAQMLNYGGMSASHFDQDGIQGLQDRLDEARALHEIDFYLLRKDGNLIASGGVEADPEVAPWSDESGRIVTTGAETYLSYRKAGYQLVLGINTGRSRYLLRLARRERGSLLFDIFVLALMAAGAAVYRFRDLRKLLQFRGDGGGGGGDGKHFHEPKTPEVPAQRLRSERAAVHNPVPSAIRAELDSKRAPPYQFSSTMARTSINQYSLIYSNHPVEEFMTVVNEFLRRSGDVITRYGGYINGFIGDEIIYYFKDEAHLDSAVLAAAAIRDIHAVAERLHRQTEPRNGYAFRVSSALASGDLRFGPQVDDFAISGPAFVETAGILSRNAENRHQSEVYLPERLAERISAVCRTVDCKGAEAGGMPGATPLYRVSGFRDSHGVWETLDEKNAALLACFLNDEDARHGLGRLLLLLTRGGATPAMTLALKAMCQARLPYQDEGIHRSFRWLLAELIRRCETHPPAPTEEFRLLSLAISGIRAMIPRNRFDSSFREMLVRCLGIEDRRVISNAIDAFSHFDPGCKDKTLLEFLDYPDNRVLANALIKLGIAKLDRLVISRLRDMLRSGKADLMASGAFAVGELARFYFGEDPLFVETHLPFQELMRELAALGAHPSERVRRQVRAAVRKAEQLPRDLAA